MKTIHEVLKDLKLDPSGLILQDVQMRSLNNVVLNLNYFGTSWALAVRCPMESHGFDSFVAGKLRTLAVTKYLYSVFSKGEGIDRETRFIFRGKSFFIGNSSMKDFLLSLKGNLTYIDRITNRTAEIKNTIIPEPLINY